MIDTSISILIVDDVPITLQFIEYHLQLAGYKNVTLFENPLDALSFIRDRIRPQLIITDFQMPQLNGVEFLKLIKDNFGFIPAIITTADIKCLETGIDTYPVILKGTPKFIEQLENQIKEVCYNLLVTI